MRRSLGRRRAEEQSSALAHGWPSTVAPCKASSSALSIVVAASTCGARGTLPAARQKQAETADGAKVGWFDVNGVLRHGDMVTDFEAAKEEILEAKVALMQAYTDAAQTKTGIEFNPADFTE